MKKTEATNIKVDKERLKRVCQKFNLYLVILFGSYSSGNGLNEESDVDIGILCENGKNIIENDLQILQEFARILKNERLDLVYLNYADPLLLYEITKSGLLLYQDKKDRFAEFKIKALKRHFDAEKFYRLEDICLERFLKRKDINDRQKAS